jgi:hypothetical protein
VAAERRYLTVLLAAALFVVLGWNLYKAEVEHRPSQFPAVTVESGTTEPGQSEPAQTTTSPWGAPSEGPAASTTP